MLSYYKYPVDRFVIISLLSRIGILELRDGVTQNDVTIRVTNSKNFYRNFSFELLTRY